ncbi:MAG: PAS domain S-box protein, partial [Desulfobacterales bacterium]|nr:PAS domain S-box protein [Desulfobacterales bacterium]
GTIQEISHTLEKDGILHYEDAPVQAKSGQVIDTDVYMVDKARLVQCNIRDIAERKRMEERLRESEERFRQWFESSPISLWEQNFSAVKKRVDEIKARNVGDLDSYFRRRPELVWELAGLVRVLDVNQATLDLYRAESKEEFFDGITKIFSKESLEGFLQVLEVIAAGEKEFVTEREHLTLDEEPLRTQLYWMVAKGHEEDYSRVLVSIIDITQLKRTEEALRQSENYYRAIFETTGSAMFIIEEDTTISNVNSIFEKMLGYSRQEVEGKKSWTEFVHPEDVEWMKKNHYLRRSDPGAAPLNYEFRFFVRDGGLRHGYLTVGMIPDTTQRVVALIDITERKQMEEDLRRERDLTQRYVDTTQTILVALDKEGRVTMINRSGCELLGYAEDEILGCNWFESFLPQPEGMDNVFPVFQRIMSGDLSSAEYFENSIVCRDGTQRLIGWHNAFLEDVDGRIVGALSSGEDITERKEAEQQLRESEERFRVLSEASFEGVVIHENGIIIDANKTYTELSGYEYDEIIGMNVLEPTSPECHDLMKQNIESNFEGAYESIGLRKDGTTFPSEIRGRKITYKGRTVRIAAIRDLSKQKKAEEELRRSEEKYRILFENVNEAIFVTQDGKFKFVNPQTEEILGLSKKKLIERPFYGLIHPEDRDMVLDKHKRRISGEDLPNVYTFRIINGAGEILSVELSTALFNWEDRPATINFLRDITQQKDLESQLRQSQKMEAIGTLAGGIAHDFNNILSSVLGYTELSMDEVEKGTLLHQNLSQVLTSGNRAKDLVKQILAFSRKEAQEFIPTSIVPLVKEALKMLRSTFPSSIEIKENISIEKGIVYAEPTQLHQLIINLASNAKQAMSDEGGILEVTVETVNFDENIKKKYPEMAPGNYVRISVSDTGCGISEQYLDKIFEPYFTTNETGTGTGLGLSVVHGIVKSHSGHISVYSEPGKGTTFHVYLPLAEPEKSRDISTGQVGKELPTGTESILLVEDEKPIIDMQQQILETLGYHVTARTSSVEALEVFRVDPYKFDLLVTDMTMPKMTGDRLALKVKEIRPDIPVILCTGFSEKINGRQRKDLGIEGFLMKPVTKKDMAEAVRKVLDGK